MTAIASLRTAQRIPNELEETKFELVTLWAYGSYKAIYEACFVDLRCLEKHNISTVLLENSRKHHSILWFSVNSHKAFPLGLVSRLTVVVPWQC